VSKVACYNVFPISHSMDITKILLQEKQDPWSIRCL